MDRHPVLDRFPLHLDYDRKNYIKEHLEGPAKIEIQFRDFDNKATSSEVLDILQETFSPQYSQSQVQHRLFSRIQRKTESVGVLFGTNGHYV